MQSATDWIRELQLIPHPEGGYFRETYRSGAPPMDSRGATDANGTLWPTPRGKRNPLTSIYWMPTRQSPIGWLCRNRSTHIHYYHAGAPLTYYAVSPAGELSVARLGPNVAAGEVMQLVVPGDYWKAAHLEAGDFCLLGEAVCPGFDSDDFVFITETQLLAEFPQHASLRRYLRPQKAAEFKEYY